MTQQSADFTDTTAADFAECCRREIVELHQFFEDWISGKLPKDKKTFTRFIDATAPGMMLVSTDGQVLDYDQLVDWIYNAHGSEPEFALWVEVIEPHGIFDSVALLTYQEWQERTGGRNVRRSTVLFEKNQDAPNGVRWLHVHETYIAKPLQQQKPSV